MRSTMAMAIAMAAIVALAAGCAQRDARGSNVASSNEQPSPTASTNAAQARSGQNDTVRMTASPNRSVVTQQSVAHSAVMVQGGDPHRGQQIFAANCQTCHGAAGAGGGIGPSLKGENKRKDDRHVVAWIKNPMPPMPKLYPQTLSAKDVADVAAYVETL